MSEWIEWNGGECPVDGDVFVDVMRTDSTVWLRTQAEDLTWQHNNKTYDIIAYRLHKSLDDATPEEWDKASREVMQKGDDDTQKGYDSVGDIDSNKKGTGARYNGGKPDFSLIPLSIIVNTYYLYDDKKHSNLDVSISLVGDFQMDGGINHLHFALEKLKDHYDDCAHVFEYGMKKYKAWNWAKGMAWSIPIACIGRHYLKIKQGEDIDQESGFSHIGHIMCNIVMLIWYVNNYKEGDDRFKYAD